MNIKKERREFCHLYRLACQQLLELLNQEAQCRTTGDYHMLRATFLARLEVLKGVAERMNWIAQHLPHEIRKVE